MLVTPLPEEEEDTALNVAREVPKAVDAVRLSVSRVGARYEFDDEELEDDLLFEDLVGEVLLPSS
jgi:hypothetical protein